MLDLLIRKRQTLKSVYDMSVEVSSMIETIDQDGSYETILDLMNKRKAAMEEIDGIDTLFKQALKDESADTAAIEEERASIRELLMSIRSIDEKSAKRMDELRATLSAGLKGVSEGRKSINAYTPAPIVNEGFEFDTRQ